MTGGPESPENSPGPVDSGPESPWKRAGVPAGALVFPATRTRKIGRRGLLGRLRGSKFGEEEKIRDSGAGIAVPVNLRPWTWEILPHVSESRGASHLAQLLDRIAWHTTPPDARYVLHAERLHRRRESLVVRALVRFSAVLAQRPSGPPPWLDDRPKGGDS